MNWTQFRAILALRWQLTRNQWRRGGQINAILTLLFVYIALGLGVCGGVGGVLLGASLLASTSPQNLRLIWDMVVVVFLFFWTTGVISELQRSEVFDLRRFLHLPVSLRGVFFLNYLASHFCLSLAMMAPAMFGMALGLTWSDGPIMALLFPLTFGVFFSITAWTYCLRGWLAALMTNKRRRRAIVMGVTMVFILLSQLPNLLTNLRIGQVAESVSADPDEQQAWTDQLAARKARINAAIEWAHRLIPPLWLPWSADRLARGNPWPAVGYTCGLALLGTWGVARAYRGAVRFCQQGETTPSTPGKAAATAVPNGRTILVERRLPVVSEEVAGMALAMFRSLLRAPEVKMSVATNILIFAVVGAGILMRTGHSIPEQAQPFVAAAAVAMTFLGLTQLMFNQFGFDRNGFRAIVLVPSPRSSVLLGKNLAVLPVAMVIFSVCIGVAAVLGHLKAWVLLATAFEFTVAFFVLCIFGNLASILVPYRIAAGSLKPTKLKAFTHLFIFITHALFPAALLPVFVPAGVGLLGEMLWSLPFAVTTIGCAALLAAVMALLYWKTLPPTGRLLQRRERAILQVVTHEIE